MEHYFSRQPQSEEARRVFQAAVVGLHLTFVSDRQVFSKDHLDTGSRLLIEAVVREEQDRLEKGTCGLDVGCGYGPLLVALAKALNIEMTGVDINERAVRLTKENIVLNGVENAQVLQADGLSGIEEQFDLIVMNPPIRAGKKEIYRLFREAGERLTETGRLYIVIRKQQGAASALRELQAHSSDVHVIKKGSGFWVLRVKGRMS